MSPRIPGPAGASRLLFFALSLTGHAAGSPADHATSDISKI
jgi:hypothetical protein